MRVLGDPRDVRAATTGDPDGGVPAGCRQARGLAPQALVPAGSWQGARLAGGPHLPASRAWALVSCVVTPGFDFADFELGEPRRAAGGVPAARGDRCAACT